MSGNLSGSTTGQASLASANPFAPGGNKPDQPVGLQPSNPGNAFGSSLGIQSASPAAATTPPTIGSLPTPGKSSIAGGSEEQKQGNPSEFGGAPFQASNKPVGADASKPPAASLFASLASAGTSFSVVGTKPESLPGSGATLAAGQQLKKSEAKTFASLAPKQSQSSAIGSGVKPASFLTPKTQPQGQTSVAPKPPSGPGPMPSTSLLSGAPSADISGSSIKPESQSSANALSDSSSSKQEANFLDNKQIAEVLDDWEKRANALVSDFNKQTSEIRKTEEELSKSCEDAIRIQDLSNKAVAQYYYLNDNLDALSEQQELLEQQLGAIEAHYDKLLSEQGVPGVVGYQTRDQIYELCQELIKRTKDLDESVDSLANDFYKSPEILGMDTATSLVKINQIENELQIISEQLKTEGFW